MGEPLPSRAHSLAGTLRVSVCLARELLGAGHDAPEGHPLHNISKSSTIWGIAKWGDFGDIIPNLEKSTVKENGWMDCAYVHRVRFAFIPKGSSRRNAGLQALPAFPVAALVNDSGSILGFSCSLIVFERLWLLTKHYVSASKRQGAHHFLSDANLMFYVPLGLGVHSGISLSFLGENNGYGNHWEHSGTQLLYLYANYYISDCKHQI